MKVNLRRVDGVLVLDKPIGISSNQALQKVKRLFQAKKAGHTGSLDVLATGLLPICLGEATKFSQFLLDADKSYEVIAQLGQCTTTGDREGDVIETKPTDSLSRDRIDQVLTQFIGEIQQVPPMYSALKRQGVPLYQLARKGISIERKARTIRIFDIQLLNWNRDQLSLRVHCSKGTYIRTLVEDIGSALGCGAYTLELRRLTAGKFQAEQMVALDKLEALSSSKDFSTLDALLLPVDTLVDSLPIFQVTQDEARSLQYGQRVQLSDETRIPSNDDENSVALTVRLYLDKQQFLGVGKISDRKILTSYRLLRQDG